MSSRQDIDVVIIGGGPAGLTTALAFVAAAPHLSDRLVVLEKSSYPRDKFCAGALAGRGDEVLARLGLHVDVPSVHVRGMSFASGEGESTVRVGPIGRVVRRLAFDDALAREAMRRGVRVLDGTRVETVAPRAGGPVIETNRGTWSPRVVVGADGVGSVVRRAMNVPPGRLRAQVLELDTPPTPADRPRDLLCFDTGERDLVGYYWDFPTLVDGREMVCRGVYQLRIDDEANDLQARLGARLRGMGLDIAAFKKKRFAERGFDPPDRVAAGSMMLVGEAAGIDPITGEGIAQAIEYGALAGPFLRDVMAGRAAVSGWRAVLQRSRLGLDLRARHALIGMIYGRGRRFTERLFARVPAILALGVKYFGGSPPQPTLR